MVIYYEFVKYSEEGVVQINPELVEAISEHAPTASTISMRSGKVHTVHGDTRTVRDVLMGKANSVTEDNKL